jgi:hypothetical protein
MVRRVFPASKTTVGKTKQRSPVVILKEVLAKGTKPAVADNLPGHERETLLAIARVLTEK